MRRPVIGIPFHRKIRDNYGKTLFDHGAIPLYLGVLEKPSWVLPLIDGLLLAGGGDPLPQLYGEDFTGESGIPDVKRDLFEIEAVQNGIALGLPLFCICRGMQILNIALGGSLYQDIGGSHRQRENPLKATHAITVAKESHLYSLLGEETMMVNSFHHQCIKSLGRGLVVSARAEDSMVEAVEGKNILGVQWHPEWLSHREGEQRLFADFVGRAYDYSQKTKTNRIE